MKALSLQQLRKTYNNGFTALKGIDLDVEEGDFFALLGPNGAGKSTTIGIVSSLVTKTSGTVRIFGHDLDRSREAAKQCIGLVPQEINFNQFENVLNILVNQAGYYGIPRRRALESAETCLRQLDLWDRRDGVSRQLSGGMKRRLMIARALVHKPRLLILDEPTAGVDIEIRRSMWEFLRKINREGTTIILTTHYLEEAESLCRNIAIINHGEIMENTRMAALLASLHSESFLLDLATPLDHPPELTGYRLTLKDANTLEVSVPRDMGMNRLFEQLGERGIAVRSLRNKSNRLEQMFVDLLDQPRQTGS
jgi:ABC-2 type transport system ATP-binding protein